jgi:hypothetical protein
VLAALLTGQSIDAVADEYKLPRGTVLDWKRQARLAVDMVRTEKTGETDIVGLLDAYLARNLETVAIQAEAFRDRTWIFKYSPSEAAVLHGVLVDKAVRILQASEAAGAPEVEAAEEAAE